MLVFDFSMGVIACDNYIKSYTFMGNCSSYNLKCWKKIQNHQTQLEYTNIPDKFNLLSPTKILSDL